MVNEKTITLCADDFSFSPAISQGILQLVENQRLTAVSCMTNMPYWSTHASWLKPFVEQIDVGLHLNLSDGDPLSSRWSQFPTHVDLIKSCYCRKMDVKLIYDEFKQQLLQFQEKLERLPDFIDGHMHIHQLPIIRHALLQLYHDYFPQKNCYIRVSGNNIFNTLKQSVKCPKILAIYLTGYRGLKKLAVEHNIPHNAFFTGIYNFNNLLQFSHHAKLFLQNSKSNTLMMCHPGLLAESSDPIAERRVTEFNYLMSEEFLEDCKVYNVKLSRMKFFPHPTPYAS